MKTTVSTSNTFKYVLLFTFLFAAFLALAITYNKVYKLKNEIITIVEKYEGAQTTGLSIINNYLKSNSYITKGTCEIGEYGVTSLTGNSYEKVSSTKKEYLYCLSYYCEPDSRCKIGGTNNSSAPNGNNIYYKVKLFYKFNLPFFGDIITFKVTGETKAIKYYSTKQKLS